MSYCYLLLFSAPLGSDKHQAQHYLGYTSASLKKRLAARCAGTGARITAAAVEQGIELTLVRHWSEGNRSLERQLKRWKKHPSLCPACKPLRSATNG